MSTITTRAGKGSALTHNELDANFKKAAQAKVANYTVAESDNRDTIQCSGTFTVTLPDATAVVAAADSDDFEVFIKNIGTGTITVARTTGTDTIDGTAANITILAKQSALLKVDQAGTGYNILGGTNNLLGLTSTVTELNYNDVTTLGTVEASKTVTADASGNFRFDVTSTEKRMRFSNATYDSYIYSSTNGIVGLYDFANTRGVIYYTPGVVGATNTITIPTANLIATGGVTADVTGDVTGNVNGNVTATTITKASVSVYGRVLLDQQVALVSADATVGSWTTVDMSVVYAAAVTAGAKSLILKIKSVSAETGSNNAAASTMYLRKTGTGLAANDSTLVLSAQNQQNTAAAISATASGFVEINVDSNGDFDWYHAITGDIGDVDIYIVGYYV